MIRFSCPRCKSVLEQPENTAGSKVACPKCNQRLQVPLPPPNKTVLGDYVGNAPGPATSASAPVSTSAFDAQVRLVNGREVLAWDCPLCQSQVEIALDLGQKTIRCPHCAMKINVPQPGAGPASMPGGDRASSPGPLVVSTPPPASLPAPTPPPPPPVPRGESYVQSQSATRMGEGYDDDRDRPRSRARRRDEYDDDDDDYDYRPVRRRPIRYQREYSTWAATAGLICSLASIGILVISFFLWIVMVDDRRNRWDHHSADAMVVLFLLATLGSFVLGILGVVFSSRGLDGSNDHNRGMAVGGLVCGILGLVLSVIFAIPVFFCGMILWTFRGFR